VTSAAQALAGAASFAAALYRQRAAIAVHGYVLRDPLALLSLGPGRADPYRVYERMRAGGPIVPTRLGNWATTGHGVTDQVLRDRRFGVRGTEAGIGSEAMDLSFLERDPPDHTRLRRLAAPAFGPRRMADYRPRVERVTADLVDRAAASGRFDLVSAIAAPLPIAVITDLLGIPEADAVAFARYGATIGGALDGVRSLRHARQLIAARSELDRILGDLLDLRRREPADDLVSRLLAAEGATITTDELLPMCTLLLIAGFETTVNLIGNAVHALLADPDQWAQLRDEPGLAAAAVEESLRHDPPVQRTARVAHEAVDVAGVRVRPDQWVVTLIGAANRDPAVYDDPDRFDLHRFAPGRDHPADHLAFSGGIHYCVGQPLARLEGEVALATLAERLDLAPAGRPSRRSGTTIRGFLHLPVTARSGRRRVTATRSTTR
jgi:cytochrome P450